MCVQGRGGIGMIFLAVMLHSLLQLLPCMKTSESPVCLKRKRLHYCNLSEALLLIHESLSKTKHGVQMNDFDSCLTHSLPKTNTNSFEPPRTQTSESPLHVWCILSSSVIWYLVHRIQFKLWLARDCCHLMRTWGSICLTTSWSIYIDFPHQDVSLSVWNFLIYTRSTDYIQILDCRIICEMSNILIPFSYKSFWFLTSTPPIPLLSLM